jgi:hypothetical protein
VGVVRLRAASLSRIRDQSPRISHSRVEEVPSPSAKAEEEGRKRSAGEYSAWGCPCHQEAESCESSVGADSHEYLLSSRAIRTHWTESSQVQLTSHSSDVFTRTCWTLQVLVRHVRMTGESKPSGETGTPNVQNPRL